MKMIFETIEGHLGAVQGRSGEEGRGNKRIVAKTKRGSTSNNHADKKSTKQGVANNHNMKS